jgi:hypothetical protein
MGIALLYFLCVAFIVCNVSLLLLHFCVLCLIVEPLPPGRNPFAVQLYNNNKAQEHL